MTSSPWVDVWKNVECDSTLDSLVEIRSVQVNIHSQSAYEIAHWFSSNASKIFLCDAQNRSVLRSMLAFGRTHAITNFLDAAHFDRQLMTEYPWGSSSTAPLGITGLSGLGKTSLIEAFVRLVVQRRRTVDTELARNLPVQGLWHATLRDTASISDVLEQFLIGNSLTDERLGGEQTFVKPCTTARRLPKQLKKIVRFKSYRNGVAAICLDELQFGSRGDAFAWITNLMLQLIGFGPVVFFSTNYSLLHKFYGGSHEVRRRLLSNIVEMHPYADVSSDWLRFIVELMRILPNQWGFEAENIAEQVLRFSGGIRDNLVALLKGALVIAGSRRPGSVVSVKDIEQSYLSSNYSARRDDVETLLSKERLRQRKDLFSPLVSRKWMDGSALDGQSVFELPRAQPVEAESIDSAYIKRQRVLDAIQDEQTQKNSCAERQSTADKRPRGVRSVVVPLRPPTRAKSLADVVSDAADLIKK